MSAAIMPLLVLLSLVAVPVQNTTAEPELRGVPPAPAPAPAPPPPAANPAGARTPSLHECETKVLNRQQKRVCCGTYPEMRERCS